MQAHETRIERVENDLRYGGVTGERVAIADWMQRQDIPGVSVAVIDEGRVAWARGYGVRDATSGGDVGTETLFHAASISKPTAALGVMRLVERGTLELDRDVNDYLRRWRVPPVGAWQPRLTLRQLLSHGAGLTVHGFPGYAPGRPLPTLTQILDGAPPANTPPVRVDTLPGLHFRYSGGGTTVAQLAVEDVTGEPFADFMRREVLEPLGMADSAYAQPPTPQMAAQAAHGHYAGATPLDGGWHVYPELAAAGLWTTPTDLARMALAVQRIWHGEEGGWLRPATIREMLTPQMEQLGIGFFLEGDGAGARFSHWGGNEGFTCVVIALKERGQGATIMTNSDEGPPLITALLDAIAREYNWPDYPLAPRRSTTTLPSDALAGEYVTEAGARIVVTARDGALRVAIGDQPAAELDGRGGALFGVGRLETEIEFVAQEGRVPEMIVRQNGREDRARRA